MITSKAALPERRILQAAREDLAAGPLPGLGGREGGRLHPPALPARGPGHGQEAARGAAHVQERSRAEALGLDEGKARPEVRYVRALVPAAVHHAVVEEVPLPLQ